MFLVFEYMPYDLTGLIESSLEYVPCIAFAGCRVPSVLPVSPPRMTIDHVRLYGYQLLEALAYMHRNKFMHRDLKSSNILLGDDHTLKVCAVAPPPVSPTPAVDFGHFGLALPPRLPTLACPDKRNSAKPKPTASSPCGTARQSCC